MSDVGSAGAHATRSREAGRVPGRPELSLLTRNEQLVMGALGEDGQPRKAYELLSSLKAQGVRAPMTVYRALERLERKGLVHKLDGLGAFVACTTDAPHMVQAFLVCEECEGVTEVSEDAVPMREAVVDPLSLSSGFRPGSAKLEIRGRCRACSAASG